MQDPKNRTPIRRLETAAGEVHIFPSAELASCAAADRVEEAVRAAVSSKGRAVLGLPTGGTPIHVYKQLVARHQAGELSFRNVSAYNLDEYYPISPCDSRSYRTYMHQHLFAHVDIAPHRAHVLDGSVPEEFVTEHCAGFERWIAAEDGLDLQLLGIGRNGHIGFNEPSDLAVDQARGLRTRLATLHPVTRADAARDFDNDEARVPPRALTMGIGTILDARSIVILAFGSNKAEAVAAALFGPITPRLPASLLQTMGSRVVWLIDEAAATRLPH